MKNIESVKEKGCDAGKKVFGIKRDIAVDINGLSGFIHIATAGEADRGGVVRTRKT